MAHGGEILISEACYELLRNVYPESMSCVGIRIRTSVFLAFFLFGVRLYFCNTRVLQAQLPVSTWMDIRYLWKYELSLYLFFYITIVLKANSNLRVLLWSSHCTSLEIPSSLGAHFPTTTRPWSTKLSLIKRQKASSYVRLALGRWNAGIRQDHGTPINIPKYLLFSHAFL